MSDERWVLWEDRELSLQAAFNPAIPRTEGCHIVLLQKQGVSSPWQNPGLYARMSRVAAEASGVLLGLKMADWVNIQYNGNIGAAKGNPNLHVHLFGRLKTSPSWGGPLPLPMGEGPFGNDPLTGGEIKRLRSALESRL